MDLENDPGAGTPPATDQPSPDPLPPAALRQRVAGTSDPVWFETSGRRTVLEWQRALALAGSGWSEAGTIVDFGCGCGRALRHLLPLLRRDQRLIGLDVDGEAIGWLQDCYPLVSAFLLRERPPAPLATASVDLILSHSVFSHLPEELQLAWVDELARLLRGGGLLLASLHGPRALGEHRAALRQEGRLEALDSLDEALRRKGFWYDAARLPAENALPASYGLAFHDIGYVQRAWQESFTLLAWLPGFALDFQDLVILRRKPGTLAQ